MKDIDGYVTKDSLYRLISNIKRNPDISVDSKTCSIIVEAISDMPKEDVKPIRYAHWIELPKALNPNENPCKCSNCGHILSFMNGYPKSKCCDDCGADMTGGNKNG